MKRICGFVIGLALLVMAPVTVDTALATADPGARAMDYQQATDVVIMRGLSQRGVPFSWAGGGVSGPTLGKGTGMTTVGFDASGLMQYAYAGAGIKLPRSSGELYRVGQKILPQQARRGDLIFYGPDGTQSVAMYLGNNQMLEVGDVVQVSPVRANGMTPYLVRVLGVQQAPLQQAPLQQAPGQQAPVQQPPSQQAPVQQAPVQQAPVQQAPVQQAPLQQMPLQLPTQAPVQQIPGAAGTYRHHAVTLSAPSRSPNTRHLLPRRNASGKSRWRVSVNWRLIMGNPAPPRPPVATATPVTMGARTGGLSGFYRYDLDGLRGIAIALVAMFHVWFGRVSGGVDVFLALSGFFFGGKILRAALDPAVSLSPVAEVIRLIRRLVPALVVVLAACALLTILVQPQTRWETFADQSLASLGYYQNWELASTASNYLRAGEAVTPLQHIWSMSVQGQFYIAFLLLVAGFAYALRRPLRANLRGAFIALLSGLTLASFIYAIFAHQADQTTAYYNSFARAWELLLGALVGALVPHVRWPMWLRTVLATVALAAILSCGVFIDGVEEFPGPWALVPVGATMLMILAGANLQARPGSSDELPPPNRLLATAPLVALGAMAYSLYLWHWPLLIFWLSYTGHAHANFVEGTAILLVSGVLAHLTVRLVEDPLRFRASGAAGPPSIPWQLRLRRPTIVLGSTVALLGVTLTATSFTWRQHVIVLRAAGKELSGLSTQDYPGARALTAHVRVPTLPMRPTVLEVKDDIPDSTRDGCISDFVNPAVVNCTYGDVAATRTIALAGGSHAEHWLPALQLLGQLHHFKVVTYLKMGCPLSTEQVPLIMGNNAPYPQCREWVQRTMAKLIADRPDYVFTTSTRPWNIKAGDVMPATYIGIWQTLSDNNIPILAMRDTPWLVKHNKPFDPADCLAKGGTAQSCEIKRSDVLADHNQTLDFVGQFPLLKPLDMSDAICRADFCRPVEGNVLIYHGAHHLSPTYVRTMAPELGVQIAASTGWW